MPSRRTFFETILLKFKYLISYQSIPENILTKQDNFYYEQEYLYSCVQRVGSHVGSKGNSGFHCELPWFLAEASNLMGRSAGKAILVPHERLVLSAEHNISP